MCHNDFIMIHFKGHLMCNVTPRRHAKHTNDILIVYGVKMKLFTRSAKTKKADEIFWHKLVSV